MSSAITASLEQLVSANWCQNFEPGISWCRHFVPSVLFSMKVPFVRVHIILSTWRRVHFFCTVPILFWWKKNCCCLLHMYHQLLLLKSSFFPVQRQFFLMNEELLLSLHMYHQFLLINIKSFRSCTTSVQFDEWRTAAVFFYTCTISVPFDEESFLSHTTSFFPAQRQFFSMNEELLFSLHMYHQFFLMKSPFLRVQRQFFLMTGELQLSFTHVPSVPFNKDSLLSCTTSIRFDEWRTAVVFYTRAISNFRWRSTPFVCVHNVSSFWWMKNCSCLLHMYHQFLLMQSQFFNLQPWARPLGGSVGSRPEDGRVWPQVP